MLVADTPNIDLGSIKFGKPLKFTYTIRNTGDKDVKIKKLSVGCGSCTVATIQPDLVKASSQGTVNVTFTPGSIGIQKKWVDVLYDNTSLRLEFRGESHE